MNHSDLIQRLFQAASYSMAAATGTAVDKSGRTKSLNMNDTRMYASQSCEILKNVIQELSVDAGAETNNP